MITPEDDIQDLLAAYALDALEPEEIARLHTLLADRPDLRATLAELRATANQLPYALPEAVPPPELRQRVLDYATGRATRSPASRGRAPGRARGWLLALGSLAAAAVIAAAIGWGQAIGARNELARAQTELVRARQDLAAAQQVIAQLQGDAGHGTMVRTNSGETILAVKLPALQRGRTYQLWRIQGSNQPASAGLFTVDQQGYGTIAMPAGQQPQPGETFAVTDEPDGGSPGPTTQPLIAGNVSG
jgi:anti-sigma-K factor RskA